GGIRPRGGGVDRGRGRVGERLVRAEGVVLVAPAIEAALLLSSVALRRAGALALQGEVHALVAAVLVWGGGLGEIGQDAEADPPDRERREAPERLGGKGDAVIGADAPGQAVLLEEGLEDGASFDQRGAGECLTRQEQAAIAVGDCEREAVLPVAQLELTLVV